MKKAETELKWHRLDNTANVFPAISNENLSSVYRIAVVLKEDVVPGLLNQALNYVLPWFEGMDVRLRRGVFWYYFETNPKPALLNEEYVYPCRYIESYSSNQYLFRVSYYKNKINVEIFHALTDGYGAINFLKELTAQYLHLRYPDKFAQAPEGPVEKTSFQVEDSYEKYYKKERARGYGGVVAYEMRDDQLFPGVMGVTHGFLDIPSLKEVCKRYGVSITQYLAAVLVHGIYREYYQKRPDKHAIRINIPVNLRQYFPSETTMNFFGVIFAEMKLNKKKSYTFEEILAVVSEDFSSQLTKEHMEELIAYNVSNTRNKILRIVPLFLKNLGIKLVYSHSSKAFTTTLSNLGLIRMLPEYEPFVENFHFIMGASPKQTVKCVVCSYGKELIFTFSSAFKNNRLQQAFFRRLEEDGVQLRVEGNGVYEGEEPEKIPYPKQLRDEQPGTKWITGYLGATVVLQGLLMLINFMNYQGVPWSLVSGGVAVYLWITMRFAIHHNTNPAAKIMWQTLGIQGLCLLVDWISGYKGWSLNYAAPSFLILANGLNLILTMVNRVNWQSYLLFQMEYVALALVLLVLLLVGAITRPLWTLLALAAAVVILAASVLLGKKKARIELQRRFHI